MQAAVEALYSKYAANSSPPYVTIACNWVENFPYPDASFIDEMRTNTMNLSHLINDFHNTIAVLSLCDAFVSVDTGIVHAAGALGIPGVARFGPFPPETHVAQYPTVLGIRTEFTGCICHGPCLETHRGCAETQYAKDTVSRCFASLEPEKIIGALDFITRQSGHLVYEDRQALEAEGAA